MFISSIITSFSSLLLAATPFVLANDGAAAGGAFLLICGMFICVFAVMVLLYCVPLSRLFAKAGQPAWTAYVPYLNNCVMAHVAGRDWWWGLIPFLNLVPLFELAKAFGKSDGFGIGLVLLSPVFLPILGFGNAQYQGEPRKPLF